MANPEHVRIVRQGKNAIAEWRASHPHERLDLSAADFRSADLRSADLSGADLSGADLSEANLFGADLSGASLHGARLLRADLSGATIFRADLSGADLNRADLIWAGLFRADLGGAALTWANLTGATLEGANVERAELYETVLVDIDLSRVRGLASVVHRGPAFWTNGRCVSPGRCRRYSCAAAACPISTSNICPRSWARRSSSTPAS